MIESIILSVPYCGSGLFTLQFIGVYFQPWRNHRKSSKEKIGHLEQTWVSADKPFVYFETKILNFGRRKS